MAGDMQELMDLRRLDELETRAGGGSMPAPQQDNQPQDPSLMQRVGQDVSNRLDAAQNAPDLSNFMISSARIVPGVLSDTMGQMVAPVAKPVMDATGISGLLQELAHSSVGMKTSDFLKQHPTVANALGLGVDLAGSWMGGSTAAATKEGLASAGESVAKSMDKTPLPVTGAPKNAAAIPAEDIKAIGQDIYRGAAQTGGEFNPQFTDKLASSLEDHRITSEFSGIGKGGKNPVNDYINDFQKRLKGKPMSLEDFNVMDSELGDLAHATRDIHGTMTQEGVKYMDIQRSLREKVLHPVAGDITDPAAFEATKKATAVYADYFKMRDIEKVIDRAKLMDNPTSSLKTGFRQLYLNAKKTIGYSEQEKNLLKKAAETGVTTGLLRMGASRLNAIAAYYAAGPVAGGVTYGIGRAAEKMAERLQMAPIRKLSNQIGARVSKNALEGQNILKGN